MEHSQLKINIKLFLEGRLSLQEEENLLEWIKLIPENRKYFLDIQQKISIELNNERDELVTFRWKQLLRRIETADNLPVQNFKSTKKYYRIYLQMAAIFVIGFFAASAIFTGYFRSEKLVATNQNIFVPYGARTHIMLPDSSSVWLNSGSELTFPSRFGDKRPVSLKGEAYFEVKKSNQPFIVSTEFGDVEVKGTSFDVKAFHDELFQTTLVTGKVNILGKDKQEVVLNPGYQAVYSENKFKVEQVDTEIYTSWIGGVLIFRNELLPQLAKRLEKWYNVKIELENDPRLQKIIYSGTIELESFSEVLTLLSFTAPVDYTWDEKNRIIRLIYKKNKK